MADDQALHQGPPGHLAGGSRGRTQIIALYNPTASQVMSPTDLPQCHQHPGDLAKLPDHHPESSRGLACHHRAQGLKLQHIRPGERLQKWFTSI